MDAPREKHRFHDFSATEEVAVVNDAVPERSKEAKISGRGCSIVFPRRKQLVSI